MIFLIGGKGQGKLDIVKKRYADALIIDARDLLWQQMDRRPVDEILGRVGADTRCVVVNEIHLITKLLFENGKTTEEVKGIFLDIAERIPNCVYISDEIGCGIVPMEKSERIWREETGRIQCFIAEQAEAVERVVCGIPVKIK